MKIPFSMTQDSLTVFHNGPKTFLAGTVQYAALRSAILEERWDDIPGLLTTAGAMSAFLCGLFDTDAEGQITHRGVVLPESIQNRIRVIANAGGDVGPLFRLYERLSKNPSFNSRTQLHRFLEHNDISVEKDGTFLAYKGINDDMTDRHTGTIDNSPGSQHEMDRNLVSDDLDVPCHFGFHVGALHYASGFGSVVVICRVDPEHVVAVPKDHNSQKMRVCKYEVIGEWSGEVMTPLADDEDLPGWQGDAERLSTVDYDYDYDGEDDEDLLADDELEDALASGRRGRLVRPPYSRVAVYEAEDHRTFAEKGFTEMKTRELMDQSLDDLRRYASNELLIHGASKIPGGKSALVSKIMNVRRRRK